MFLRFLFSLIFIVLILPLLVHAEAAETRSSCMATHMKDAIKLNQHRDPIYQRLSNKRSAPVTRRLIAMERRLLFLSAAPDLWAVPFQRAGIPIVCEDVIDMSKTPELKFANPDGRVAKSSYRHVLIELVKTKLQERLDNNDFAGLAWLSDQYIQQLQKQPRFNCLVRHMLESIRRSSVLAPQYVVMAEEKGLLKSPARLSKALLQAHLDLLSESAVIDKLAAPIQADGVMILCQDVPHIPVP